MMRNPFVISGILEPETGDKVAFDNLNLLEDSLSDHLQLSDYGSGLKAIAIIFIAVQPDNTIHEEEISYRRRKKEVYIQVKLPYEQVLEFEKPQVLHLMAETYLQTIRRLPELNIPDFDCRRFEQDVEGVFEQMSWGG